MTEAIPRPDVSEAVGVALQALSLVNMLDDPDRQHEELTSDFQALAPTQGGVGELYPQVPLPKGLTTVQRIARVLHQNAEESVYGLAIIGPTGRNTYLNDVSLNSMGLTGKRPTAWRPHGRLAVSGAAAEADPLLHFTDRSDPPSRGWPQMKKLQALHRMQIEYERANPNYNLGLVNTAAFLMLALQHQIKGEKMPLDWSDSVIPQLTIPIREDGTHILIHMQNKGSVMSPIGGQRKLLPTQEVRGIGISAGTNQGLERADP